MLDKDAEIILQNLYLAIRKLLLLNNLETDDILINFLNLELRKAQSQQWFYQTKYIIFDALRQLFKECNLRYELAVYPLPSNYIEFHVIHKTGFNDG